VYLSCTVYRAWRVVTCLHRGVLRHVIKLMLKSCSTQTAESYRPTQISESQSRHHKAKCQPVFQLILDNKKVIFVCINFNIKYSLCNFFRNHLQLKLNINRSKVIEVMEVLYFKNVFKNKFLSLKIRCIRNLILLIFI